LVQEILRIDLLVSYEITLLVQDHQGHIIPFGWRQDDIDYLNAQNIWQNQNLICFQKLRLLAINSRRKQRNFADNMIL